MTTPNLQWILGDRLECRAIGPDGWESAFIRRDDVRAIGVLPDARAVKVETDAETVPLLCETSEEAVALGEKLCAWVRGPE